VEPAADAFPKRREWFLPTPHVRFRGEALLEERQLSVEVRGDSLQWRVTELAVITFGVALCYLARRRKRNTRSDSKPP
jgi:hypothetical protein